MEYDLSNAGTYTVRAWRPAFDGHPKLESNTLSITLTGSLPPERPKTPFRLRINTDEPTVEAGSKILVNEYLTNTSDHDIPIGPRTMKLDIKVRDAEGNLAPLTEAGRQFLKIYGQVDNTVITYTIPPGDTHEIGAVSVDGLYDMSRPGDYTIQILEFDDETDSWVKSNTITITVTPS